MGIKERRQRSKIIATTLELLILGIGTNLRVFSKK